MCCVCGSLLCVRCVCVRVCVRACVARIIGHDYLLLLENVLVVKLSPLSLAQRSNSQLLL